MCLMTKNYSDWKTDTPMLHELEKDSGEHASENEHTL